MHRFGSSGFILQRFIGTWPCRNKQRHIPGSVSVDREVLVWGLLVSLFVVTYICFALFVEVESHGVAQVSLELMQPR